MASHRDSQHEFALYLHELSEISKASDILRIDDAALVHRVLHVLRLQKDDILILFDQCVHVRASLESIEKKAIVCRLHSVQKNIAHVPKITVWLPLLKRESFEEAIYALVEMGVNSIQLLHTTKEHHRKIGQKEMQRIHNIMIAAAEQSKNFSMAEIFEPRDLTDLLTEISDAQGIFFDVNGRELLDVAQELHHNKKKAYVVVVGP